MSEIAQAPVSGVNRLPGAKDDGRPTQTLPCPCCFTPVTVWLSVGFPICKDCESIAGTLSATERMHILARRTTLAAILGRRGALVTTDRLHTPAMYERAIASRPVIDWIDSGSRTLVLYGPIGTGKSYQSVGALRSILERSHGHGYLINAATLSRMSRVEFDIWSRCTAFALDDLGAKLTPTAIASAYEIIDYRISHLLPLIVSTNQNPAQTIDERIDSRLAAAKWIEVTGPDRRLG